MLMAPLKTYKDKKMLILRNNKNEFVYSFKNYRDAISYAQHNHLVGYTIV